MVALVSAAAIDTAGEESPSPSFDGVARIRGGGSVRRPLLSVVAGVAIILTAVPATVYADDPIPGTSGYTSTTEASPLGGAYAFTSSDALQPLATFSLRGGYASAGVAMRNRGFGTITLSDIPSGSSIRAAYLFWAILGDGPGPFFSQGSINGQGITGVAIGVSADPCWGNAASFGYRADVTALITGNGDYSLAGFASGIADGRDPWNANPPRL